MYGLRTRFLALHQKEWGLANRGGAVALPYGMYGSRTRFLALHQKERGLANCGGAVALPYRQRVRLSLHKEKKVF